jgi:hypothetical protein
MAAVSGRRHPSQSAAATAWKYCGRYISPILWGCCTRLSPYYTGFRVNSGEYKVMGLAPYGEPHYANRILDHLIDLKSDGSFRLNLAYFDYCVGLKMTNRRFDALFGGRRAVRIPP